MRSSRPAYVGSGQLAPCRAGHGPIMNPRQEADVARRRGNGVEYAVCDSVTT
ncbi:hypothetical protein [Actinobaculum sp. 352]|uniref:hypothetical protein n=1 Tax=Actinobaculum sp. 352 TaxID=2490946 RepID=UPI0019D07DA8|nr:hypothetical protein [Actinobaculum sp. 352]